MSAENTSEGTRSNDGPVGPRVSMPAKINCQPGDPKKSKDRILRKSSSESDVKVRAVTEPSISDGNFEELVEKRLLKRRNSFQESKTTGPNAQRLSGALLRAPTSLFMALMGDKDLSDQEFSDITSDESTTTKESEPSYNKDKD